MVNTPDSDEKQARINAIGHSTGAAVLKLLTDNTECNCVACQAHVAFAQLEWVCHGESLETVRKVLLETIGWVDALTDSLDTQQAALDLGPAANERPC